MNEKGKALVTGGNRGLGKALVLALAERGFEVVAGVRDPAKADGLQASARGLPGAVEVVKLDVTALGDYEPPANLRILINNAGYRGQYLPVEEAAIDEWRKTFETNFFGVVELTRRAIPALRNAGNGIICNIGSMGAYMPMPFYTIYRSSKLALAALSEGLRIELASFGVRVIEVPIGGVDTDMLRTSIACRPPDAINFPLYRPMAEQQAAMPTQASTDGIAPEVVARQVIDTLFQEGSLRRACDPNAVRGMVYVDTSLEEERAQTIFESFGLKSV